MKEIKLTQGYVTQVDDDMYEYLNQWKWVYDRGYAVRTVWRGGKPKTIRMHAVIAGTPLGMETDHKKDGGLLNLRSNLRVCTHSENLKNLRKNINNKSGYKGVSWDKNSKKWYAKITVNYHQINLGCYSDIIDAARAYDNAAKKYFGEFSALNLYEGVK